MISAPLHRNYILFLIGKMSARILTEKRGPSAPPSRNLNWDSSPEALVDKTLELMGAGTKIAVEVAIMTTDAGVLKERERVYVLRNFQNTNRMSGTEILKTIPY